METKEINELLDRCDGTLFNFFNRALREAEKEGYRLAVKKLVEKTFEMDPIATEVIINECESHIDKAV